MRRCFANPSRLIRPILAGCTVWLCVLAPSPVHAQHDAFVDRIVGLNRAYRGAYGDEGPRVLEEIHGLAAALRVWDTSDAAAETQLRARLEGASHDVQLQVHARLASVYLSRGKFHDGLGELDKAVAIEPGRSELHLLRGRLLDAIGRATEAANAYARAWELDPLNAAKAYLVISSRPAPADGVSESPPRRALIDAHRRRTRLSGNKDSTPPIVLLTLIMDGASSRPIFVPALYVEGFRLIKAGRHGEAIVSLREAATNDPLVVDRISSAGPMSSGIALLRDGRFREAIPLLESAATAHPNSSEAQRILGSVYGATGDDDRAVAHLRTAMRLAPADERTRVALGKRLRDAGRLSEAEQALRDAALILPESGEVRWLLADVLERAGRGLEADVWCVRKPDARAVQSRRNADADEYTVW